MFRQDLDLGEAYQREFLAIKGGGYMVQGCFKPYDVIVEGVKYEVKCDRMTRKTGNVVIEFECNNVGSGITTTEADYWVYFVLESPEEYLYYYEIPVSVIRRMIIDGKFHRCVSGGDGHRSHMYLFNESLFSDYKRG